MSSNQSINKTPNSRFLLFSHRCTQTLGFNAYLSPDQDEPGLTRLTRNTDWAFSSTKSEKTKKINFFSERLWFHEFWFLLTHLPTLHQFLLFYKMSYVLHQMSDITTTKQQVIKKKQSWVLAQFCKSKRYQIQKIKKEFTKPRKSRFLPHIFFLWSPSKPIKATYLKLWPSSEKIRISNSLKSGFWKKKSL